MKAGLSDAFGSVRCPDFWGVLHKRAESSSADAFVKAVTVHGIIPERIATPGAGVPIHTRCKQDAPESTVLWKLL